MSKKILVASNGNPEKIHLPSIKTAVSNLSIFNEQYTKPILNKIEDFGDDSDNSRLPTLEEIIEKKSESVISITKVDHAHPYHMYKENIHLKGKVIGAYN